MIRSHIGSTQECGVVFKLERFSHLLGRPFGMGSLIGLEALSIGAFIESRHVAGEGATWKRATRCPKDGFGVNAIKSVSHPK